MERSFQRGPTTGRGEDAPRAEERESSANKDGAWSRQAGNPSCVVHEPAAAAKHRQNGSSLGHSGRCRMVCGMPECPRARRSPLRTRPLSHTCTVLRSFQDSGAWTSVVNTEEEKKMPDEWERKSGNLRGYRRSRTSSTLDDPLEVSRALSFPLLGLTVGMHHRPLNARCKFNRE